MDAERPFSNYASVHPRRAALGYYALMSFGNVRCIHLSFISNLDVGSVVGLDGFGTSQPH